MTTFIFSFAQQYTSRTDVLTELLKEGISPPWSWTKVGYKEVPQSAEQQAEQQADADHLRLQEAVIVARVLAENSESKPQILFAFPTDQPPARAAQLIDLYTSAGWDVQIQRTTSSLTGATP